MKPIGFCLQQRLQLQRFRVGAAAVTRIRCFGFRKGCAGGGGGVLSFRPAVNGSFAWASGGFPAFCTTKFFDSLRASPPGVVCFEEGFCLFSFSGRVYLHRVALCLWPANTRHTAPVLQPFNVARPFLGRSAPPLPHLHFFSLMSCPCPNRSFSCSCPKQKTLSKPLWRIPRGNLCRRSSTSRTTNFVPKPGPPS